MTVRVGLVGLGMMGTTHFNGYKEIDEADVSALCDVQVQRLKGDFTGTAGNIDTGASQREDVSEMKAYEQFDRLLQDQDVDMVDICLPTFLHEEKAVAALKAGKHVFCEKPMAMTHDQARRMIAAAEEAGKMLMVGQCLRFWPEYVMIKELIDSGRYGPVRSAVLRRLGATPDWSWKSWLTDSAQSGCAVLDLHIHDVDVVQWYFGKPKEVTCQGSPWPDGGLAHIVAQYGYEDVPVVVAEGGWDLHGKFPFSMSAQIIFEKATVDYSSAASPTLTIYEADGTVRTPEVPEANAYTEELRYFARCIESGQAPDRMPNASAAQAVVIAEAEIASAQAGKCVAIDA